MEEVRAIEKTLSTNDLGANGTHQGGMLIPKGGDLLSFFPALDSTAVNPRVVIYFTDESAQKWKFSFIYYNNKFRGGTRNEYRLTGMTAFFRSGNLKIGDRIIFKRRDDEYTIQYRRQDASEKTTSDGIVRLVLNSEWRIIDF
jgi:Restriction endonuclease EcoRII, N-terminal.